MGLWGRKLSLPAGRKALASGTETSQ
jgi:hypothetical protein